MSLARLDASSSFACLALFSANFCLKSASFAFFSSSVNGLIYNDIRSADCTEERSTGRRDPTDLFGRFFELLMARLLGVERCRR